MPGVRCKKSRFQGLAPQKNAQAEARAPVFLKKPVGA
jgi:hypothetical protein